MSTLTPEQLIERMEPLEAKLRSYARTFNYNDEAVEDLMQELRITAVSKVASYDPSTGPAGLKAWLKSILTNLGRRHREEMARRNEVLWNGSDKADDGDNYDPLSPLSIAIHHGLWDRDSEKHENEATQDSLDGYVARRQITFDETELTTRQRECLDAFMMHEEQVVTAQRLGISQPTVNEHLQAAFKKLRKSHEKRWGTKNAPTFDEYYFRRWGRKREAL